MKRETTPVSRPAAKQAAPGQGMTANDLRQCLRIATGGLLGFLISQLMHWNFGVFFAVFPMVLLGLVPVMNAHVIRQFLAGAVLNGVEVMVVVGLFGQMPVVMLLIVFALFYGRFALMARGPLFLFAGHGVLSTSIMYHFASYNEFSLFDLTTSYAVASLLTVCIALFMIWLFPDVEPRQPPQRPAKSANQRRHETLLGALVVTLTLVVFLVFDLRDALSAQTAIVLILFGLNYPAVCLSVRNRLIGTVLGSVLAVGMQVLLYTHSGNLLLVAGLFWIGLMLFARAHVKGQGSASVGFAGLTSMGILFGQYLTPEQDIIYKTLYRLGAVSVALVAGLLVVTLLHKLLNAWDVTRSDYA